MVVTSSQNVQTTLISPLVQSPSEFSRSFPNSFYGLFARWICEIKLFFWLYRSCANVFFLIFNHVIWLLWGLKVTPTSLKVQLKHIYTPVAKQACVCASVSSPYTLRFNGFTLGHIECSKNWDTGTDVSVDRDAGHYWIPAPDSAAVHQQPGKEIKINHIISWAHVFLSHCEVQRSAPRCYLHFPPCASSCAVQRC